MGGRTLPWVTTPTWFRDWEHQLEPEVGTSQRPGCQGLSPAAASVDVGARVANSCGVLSEVDAGQGLRVDAPPFQLVAACGEPR